MPPLHTRAILKWSGAYIDAEEIWPMNYRAMLFTTKAKTNLQCDHSSNYTGNNTSSCITICATVLVVPASSLKHALYQLTYQPGVSNKLLNFVLSTLCHCCSFIPSTPCRLTFSLDGRKVLQVSQEEAGASSKEVHTPVGRKT
ncbi:hypothetical protein BKA82DRAFT_4018745 [Pisolithus tinctorius]|nr:hypothetical protein BKA82DRAFT_4018745 [Pisolithus tinctorius]